MSSPRRGAFPMAGGHDEREQTLNQRRVELDGFDPNISVALLAATNSPEILDPALLCTGRFDHQVLVDRPDRKGRPGAATVHKVSIIPQGPGALGYTLQRPSEDRLLVTRGELMNRIKALLGGRAAEKLVFDELSTGAADDIAKATDIARSMVMRYGMDEGLGCVTYAENQPRFLDVVEGAPYPGCEASPATAQQIDAAVRRIVHTAYDAPIALLRENRAVLDRCASALLEQETLEEADVNRLTAELKSATQAGPLGIA